MSIIDGFIKHKQYIADANGDHHKVSNWTHASTVEMPDGSLLENFKSYKEVTQAQYDALPDTKLSDGVMYCITDSNTGNTSFVELTQAQYDALTPAQKNDPTKLYFITD